MGEASKSSPKTIHVRSMGFAWPGLEPMPLTWNIADAQNEPFRAIPPEFEDSYKCHVDVALGR